MIQLKDFASRFMAVHKEIGCSVYDFVFRDEANVPLDIPKPKLHLIEIVGTTNAGCVVIRCRQSSTRKPFVWIDSEGSPLCAFAKNEVDFIQLFNYSSGFWYKVMTAIQRSIHRPQFIPGATENFGLSEEDISKANLLKTKCGQELQSVFDFDSRNSDPIKIIYDAILDFNFLDWLYSDTNKH